jgi:hypothetical protein
MIAALYVEPDGAYIGLPHVDPWDEARDARRYAGPHPVVAHPPCQRWGRYAKGGTHPNSPRFEIGDDDGCFAAALASVRRWGGVLEHPAHSKAWEWFSITAPGEGGWRFDAAEPGGMWGWTCYVEQGFYGHFSRKPTWLYACLPEDVRPPELRWGRGKQRLHPVALERHGYKKARRIGMMAMVGGKDKTKIRNATPPEFRDILISMAQTALTSHQRNSQEG